MKLQPFPIVVFLFNRDCIPSFFTETALLFNLFLCAPRKFSGYETIISLTWKFCAVDKTRKTLCLEDFSVLIQTGVYIKVWWLEGSVWQILSRCPKLTSFCWCCLLRNWAFCGQIKSSGGLHKLEGIVSGKVRPVVSKRLWTVVFSSV